jgi:hypothetical protein
MVAPLSFVRLGYRIFVVVEGESSIQTSNARVGATVALCETTQGLRGVARGQYQD